MLLLRGHYFFYINLFLTDFFPFRTYFQHFLIFFIRDYIYCQLSMCLIVLSFSRFYSIFSLSPHLFRFFFFLSPLSHSFSIFLFLALPLSLALLINPFFSSVFFSLSVTFLFFLFMSFSCMCKCVCVCVMVKLVYRGVQRIC